MYKDNRIGVVVTAYDEAAFVGRVIETVPEYVDRIYAVDDRSPDDSWDVIQRVATQINSEVDGELTESELTAADGGDDRRVVPIRHEENRGYGAAVKTGYRHAVADGLDIVAVMNGDGQMDPAILDRILDPVVTGNADYAKGNRLLRSADREGMTAFRFAGNAMLTGLSKFATGYWSIGDSQNGYTAISREAIELLDLEAVTDKYGFLNHLLTHLNVAGCRVADVPMSAVYGDEESSIRYASFVRFVSLLLLRSFCWRLKTRYIVRSFNPAVVYYGTGAMGVAGGGAGVVASVVRMLNGREGFTAGVTSFVATLLGLLSLGTAIRLDAEASDELTVSCADADNMSAQSSDRGNDGQAPAQSIE